MIISREMFPTEKSINRAEAIRKLTAGRVMTAGQIAEAMGCSIQSLTNYLQTMVKFKILYSAGRQREGNQRGCRLYTSSVEFSRHPDEIVATQPPRMKVVRAPRPKPGPAPVDDKPFVPRRDPFDALFFGGR